MPSVPIKGSRSSEHLIDPELKLALELFPLLEPLTRDDLPKLRNMMSQMVAPAPQADLPVSMNILSIEDVDRPSIRVLSYRPAKAEQPLPALLHIHSGGYVLGSPDMWDLANRKLALEVNCAIFSVEYRLAPETPHPGPVEDCYAALKWLHANALTLGIDSARIGVKGESAGGGLAAALALLTRDRGELHLACQHLIYPMIDDRTGADGAPDANQFVGEYIWTPPNNRFGWECLLGATPGSAGISPHAAAARAEDLSGLPSSFIAVGALDLFLEEDVEYARRLIRAGVPTELHVYPGAYHGFDIALEARTAIAFAQDSRDALRRALHG